MDEFLHNAIHILADLESAIEKAKKQLEDLATKKALEDNKEDNKDGDTSDDR